MKKLITVLVVVGVVLAVLVLLGPFYILKEGEQAVLVRFGEIIDSQTEAGLKFKMPVIDTVVTYSRRIQSWDGESRRMPTAENQFVWVDTTARWRITDPELFYESVQTMSQAYSRLDDVIESAVRTVVSTSSLSQAVRSSDSINERIDETPIVPEAEGADIDDAGFEEIADLIEVNIRQNSIAGKGRREMSQEMLAQAGAVTPDFGIELIDIVVRQIRYSDDLTTSVYDRMISERRQIAQAYRSYGEGRKAQILGQLENDRRRILSEAYAISERIRGDADSEAARIYSEAYSQDPGFFEFWRAIESYRSVMPRFAKTLSTDMDYFKYLYSPEGVE